VVVENGTLQLSESGGKLGGAFEAKTGAAFYLVSGNFELFNTPLFQGPGLVGFKGDGEVTLIGELSGSFGFYSGYLGSGSALTVASGGTLTIVNAINLYGSLDVAAGGILDIKATVNLYAPLTYAGTVNWTGGNINVYNSAVDNWTGDIINTGGGVFNNPNNRVITLNGANYTPPVLTPHDNMIVAASASLGTVVNFTLGATGGLGAIVTSTPASGSLFPLGDTTVNMTVVDAFANTSHGSFKVTVVGMSFWSLVVAGPSTPASLAGTLHGTPGGSVILQASSDLGVLDAWQNIGTVVIGAGGFTTFAPISDPGSTGGKRDFFRWKLP